MWNQDNLDDLIKRNRNMADFESALKRLVNSEGLERYCDIPDHVIAQYLRGCFENLCIAAEAKVIWSPEHVATIVKGMQKDAT